MRNQDCAQSPAYIWRASSATPQEGTGSIIFTPTEGIPTALWNPDQAYRGCHAWKTGITLLREAMEHTEEKKK